MQSVQSLCDRYGVDMAHARFVDAAAARLFTAVAARCALPDRAWEVLRAGAYLHNVGLQIDPQRHPLVGRDIVLAAPLREFSPSERAMLACLVAFHEGSVDAAAEDLFAALSAAEQHQALALGAILRVADGLDSSGTQSTRIASVEAGPGALATRILTHGPHSHRDAAQASRKADLWRALFGDVSIAGRVISPGLALDMPLGEACRSALAYRFDRSGGRERWARPAREDVAVEHVHALRVGVRRMRHDLRLFGGGLRGKARRSIDKGLRAWSGALRQVRAGDALIEAIERYCERCDDEARDGLMPLLARCQAERRAAAARLSALAGSDDGQEWLEAFTAFLEGDSARALERRPRPGEPSHVRHLVPLALWQGLAGVRAFDVLPDLPAPPDLHALRLAIKRLRFTVEALRDVLPDGEAQAWIDRCVPAQDALGAIQDAHVAATHAQAYVAHSKPGPRPTQAIAVKGIVNYAEAQRKVIDARTAQWRDYLQPFL